jgi:phage I-like protein
LNTSTHLLNKLEAPANFRWMHVCPLGEHVWNSADGSERIVQVIDTEACRVMARSYPLSIPNSRIDIDHESMEADKRTAAVGWGRRAEVRDDGLWVEVEWNPDGHELISNKVYRFNSPCFPREGLVPLGNGRFRVTKLGVIALTNDPNLRGQKPLTNRRTNAANPNNETTHMDYKAEMLKMLGLPPEATDDQIANAAAQYSEMKKQKDAMTNRVTELETMVANRDLDEHGITDADQRKLLTPSLTNTATRPAALALLGKSKPAAGTEARPAIHNRGITPAQPAGLKADDASAESEAKKAAWIGNRSRELKSSNPNRSHRECFSQAEADFANRA